MGFKSKNRSCNFLKPAIISDQIQIELAPNNEIRGFLISSIALPLVFIADVLCAQGHLERHRIKVVHGIVLDRATSRGIPNVYVRTSKFGAISDNDGNFSMTLSGGDSLQFSHIGYLAYQSIFNESLDRNKFVIVLSPRVTFLREVTVTSLPTEIEFREKILETIPQLSVEEEIAQENIRILNQALPFALPLQMDSYQSYRDYAKGPQGVVLFSSNGSKGLIKAIKNVVRSTSYKFPSFINRTRTSLRTTSSPPIR